MKIGELAQRFNLSTQAIRYYIKEGLLVPESKDKQYRFNQQNIEDLEFILKLKEYDFSIADIHDVLSLKRISNLKTESSQNEYRSMLTKKLTAIVEEQARLRQISSAIKAEMDGLDSVAVGGASESEQGISLSFLPLLNCPVCGTSLDISDMQIKHQQIRHFFYNHHTFLIIIISGKHLPVGQAVGIGMV